MKRQGERLEREWGGEGRRQRKEREGEEVKGGTNEETRRGVEREGGYKVPTPGMFMQAASFGPRSYCASLLGQLHGP